MANNKWMKHYGATLFLVGIAWLLPACETRGKSKIVYKSSLSDTSQSPQKISFDDLLQGYKLLHGKVVEIKG